MSRACYRLSTATLLLAVGCQSSVDEPSHSTASSSLTAPTLAAGRGYAHSFAASRFHIGQQLGVVREMGLTKTVGSEGVFAVDDANGSVTTSLNGGSVVATGPFPSSAVEHEGAVRAYFVSIGVPSDQIAEVVSDYVGDGFGDATGVHINPKVAFNTILRRHIAGIPVIDSIAWARMNAQHEVVREEVYWPDVPDSVVADAVALASTMKSAPSSYLALLPQTNEVGRVVIRHSSASVHASPQFYACYDVRLDNHSAAAARHFSSSGGEIRLPQEVAWGGAVTHR